MHFRECAENGYRRRAPLEESRDGKVESHRCFYSSANVGKSEGAGKAGIRGNRVTLVEHHPRLSFCFLQQFFDFAGKRLFKMLAPVVSMMDELHGTVSVDDD
jgi:hypothetical protein